MLFLCVLMFLFTSSTLTARFSHNRNFCSINEFGCGDGACVSFDHVCDGVQDCADASDEATCGIASNALPMYEPVLNRTRRQANNPCGRNKFTCRDGTCINAEEECDGEENCPDGSDETFARCRKSQCQYNWFKCTYGACVDGNAPCNGKQECADNSDELLPSCRTEPLEVGGKFKCSDGTTIASLDACDGEPNCPDGSDETVAACAGRTCPTHLFQCAYGACVDSGSDCNDVNECADGSDEDAELCNKTIIGKPSKRPPPPSTCVLPDYPEHGKYVVSGATRATPGQFLKTAFLNYTCDTGYNILGNPSISCNNGNWLSKFPVCIRYCRLVKHASVEYRCQITGDNEATGTRLCQTYEPSNVRVIPECRQNYYYPGIIPYMNCIDGFWDQEVRCKPDCGKVTAQGEPLVIHGSPVKRGEMPWHAGIYDKTYTPYMQICGGSLVSSTMVISAAHCFWEEQQLPTENYAVAVGKLYKRWNHPKDPDPQYSDISRILIPKRFQGSQANFQSDIALLILSTTIIYYPHIKPVCLDFEPSFDGNQLTPGNKGKVAGWGLTSEDGNKTQPLLFITLPYVEISECQAKTHPSFREYLTADKICAGWLDGSALCKGDSGGGLAFPAQDKGATRYYLRGIVSTAPKNEHACNANTLTSFTHIMFHENFIKQYFSNE